MRWIFSFPLLSPFIITATIVSFLCFQNFSVASGITSKSVPSSSAPPQYYYRGGFRQRLCSPNGPIQLQSFSFSPKISVRYDGRQFNTTFSTLKKLSVMDNMVHICCNAKYPVTLLPNAYTMKLQEKANLLKTFEENMETTCHSESVPPKSPCSNYTVTTFIPVHLLSNFSIDTQCQSYCKQVEQVTTLKVVEKKGTIFGTVSSKRVLTSGEGDKKNFSSIPPPPPGLTALVDTNDHDLVQIYVSLVGGLRKNWNIKCSTNSDLTAKGAKLLLKLETEGEASVIKGSKEYRKAGIHTIRATFDVPSEDVDYVHCLFPRLNDFPWISRHSSIHFHGM